MALVATAVAALVTSGIHAVTSGASMDYSIVDDDNNTILKGDDVCVAYQGAMLCVSNGKLTSAGEPEKWSGTDANGDFTAVSYKWMPASFKTTTFSYNDGSAILYRQEFESELMGVSQGDPNSVLSSFPSFDLQSLKDSWEGYLQYSGLMVGSGFTVGNFSGSAYLGHLAGGVDNSGPACFFNKAANRSIVISAASEFMTSSQYISGTHKSLQYGVLGSVEMVPDGYQVDTIVVAHWASVRGGMMRWGDKLLGRYGKTRADAALDFTINYLQYSTDNGAYYYYNTEEGKNYEQTMVDVAASMITQKIPVKHWLMDSWWYFKGTGDGVKNWTAMPSIFPDGIGAVTEKTHWPIVAHNRYWSSNTDYAKQNGGKYNFLVEPNSQSGVAIPQDQEFWDDLLAEAKVWGLATYEQDWLNDEFNWLNCTRSSPTVAKNWLRQMGAAARKNDVHVQYCMSLPRHILMSVEIPAVTQARASNDYQPGNDQWAPLGVTGIFAHAVGIAPTKDSFWTTDQFFLSGKYGNKPEPYNRLQSAVSTLSAGPVAISDKIGMTDVPLVMRSCAASGLLLKPDRPAMMLDAVILSMASGGVSGKIWTAHSDLSKARWTYLFAAQTTAPLVVSAADIFYEEPWARPSKMVAWETNSTASLQYLNETSGIKIGQVDKWDFNYWTIAPVLASGYTMLGEIDKWITASTQRFSGLTTTATGFAVNVAGLVGEQVHLSYLEPNSLAPKTLTITIPPSGT
eukprot:gene7521-11520_t